MKKIILLLWFPIISYSQGIEKLERLAIAANEQIVITRMESIELVGDYNYLKSSLIISLEELELCRKEMENYKNLSIEYSLEIEKLSLENEILKTEIAELRKLKDKK